MTRPKNRSIPQIPRAPGAPKPGGSVPENETKPASDLTKTAIQLLQQKFNAEAEAIAAQAAKAEGVNTEEGWKLDLSGVWFRPKPASSAKG